MVFLKEIHVALKIEEVASGREVKWKAFQDNNGLIELDKCPKLRLRTKYVGIKYHHFRSKVDDGIVLTLLIDASEQQTDIVTKEHTKEQFKYLLNLLIGW